MFIKSSSFTPHFDRLKYLQSQSKLDRLHAKWISELQESTFLIKHKSGQLNKVADALSRKVTLLTTLQVQVYGFECLKDQYEEDPDFQSQWAACQNSNTSTFEDYNLLQGYLYKGSLLCIPNCSLRYKLISELHNGGLAGHFGKNKTMVLVGERFYWPSYKKDVSKVIRHCLPYPYIE